MDRPISRFLSSGGIKALIEKGKKCGYLTVEEILEVLPNELSDADHFEDIIIMIEELGIQVVRIK